MISVEDEMLERFFLGPGAQGPIRSIFVSDDDLLEIFQAEDIAEAKLAFIRSLPHPYSMARIMAGDWPPPRRSGRPDFVRILMFLCWMQVTRLRPRGERNFRHILEGHLGRQYVQLAGLNALWDSLAEFLQVEHQVELVLPKETPHPQIGRTLRIAFPTWRDRSILRKLRIRLDRDAHLSQSAVANRLLTVGSLTAVAPSFQHYFEVWNAARLAGDPDAEESPFWRAWLAIVGEVSGNDRLEVEVDEFGQLQLFCVTPDGKSSFIAEPSQALGRVSPKIAQAIRKGRVFMEPAGFGRFKSIEAAASKTLLVVEQAVADAVPGSVKTKRFLRNGWMLVTFAGEIPTAATGSPNFVGVRWVSGIRIGGAYLGRTPLTPKIEFSSHPSVEIGGQPVDLVLQGQVGQLASGVYKGKATATAGGASRSIHLVDRAVEAQPERIALFDPEREISEDGKLSGTWPSDLPDQRAWTGVREKAAPEMSAIAEALYARSVRGLSASQAFEIASEGLSCTAGKPSPWDVLRAFIDAGWLDVVTLRGFPAKRFVQCPLALYRSSASGAIWTLSGPLPLAVVDRVEMAASACGVLVEQLPSSSPFGLPTYRLQVSTPRELEDFLGRSGIAVGIGAPARGGLEDIPENVSLEGYLPAAVLSPQSGYFEPTSESGRPGLYRFEHPSGTSRHVYVSLNDRGAEKRFNALTPALIYHFSGRTLFELGNDGLLHPIAARVRLPAAWARWLALLSGATPGLVRSAC